MAPRWPRAWTSPLVSASFKHCPSDFVVREQLSFQPSGSGEHLLLHIEKVDQSTPAVAAALARMYSIPGVDVGYAGMKDKRAVASQWFSLRGVQGCPTSLEDPGLRILESTRHAAKLRRGDLAGNEFRVRLRDLAVTAEAELCQAFEYLAEHGAPNYFGEQRFGWDNLDQAQDWLADRRRRRVSKFKQGLYLSVLRAYLFNEVLGARVAAGNWCAELPGDVLIDGEPSAPLWGRGRSATAREAAAIEIAALEPHATICADLEYAGVSQARRCLRCRARNLRWAWEGDQLQIDFELGAGTYATSFLGEIFDLCQLPAAQVSDGG